MIRGLIHELARGASLIVTNRRWGATLSAGALGLGLFVGVAIGPGAAGTFATGAPQLIALPSLSGDEGTEASAESAGELEASAEAGAPLALGGESEPLESFTPAVLPTSGSGEPSPAAEAPSSQLKAPPAMEDGGEEAETASLTGVVAHVNAAASSYALAIKGGELVPVHAAKLPRPGTKLSLEGLQLSNGTFAEEGAPERRKGQAKAASFRGVVTHVDPDPLAPAYTLSGRGASLLVGVPADPTGAAPTLPAIGSYASVEATIEQDSSLLQRKLEVEPGEPTTYLDLAGIYAGLDPETGRLLLSSDDTRKGEEDLSLVVPAEIDASKLKPGDSYMATATLAPDGTLTLSGIASDERRKGADDAGSAQGDLKR